MSRIKMTSRTLHWPKQSQVSCRETLLTWLSELAVELLRIFIHGAAEPKEVIVNGIATEAQKVRLGAFLYLHQTKRPAALAEP